jgi:hypothetical protein
MISQRRCDVIDVENNCHMVAWIVAFFRPFSEPIKLAWQTYLDHMLSRLSEYLALIILDIRSNYPKLLFSHTKTRHEARLSADYTILYFFSKRIEQEMIDSSSLRTQLGSRDEISNVTLSGDLNTYYPTPY